MKTKLLSLALGLAVFSACSNVEDEVTDTGVLELKCGVNTSVNLKSSNATPSTDDFVVTIKDAQNATIKTFDPFSSAPDQVELIAGRYNVEAYSQAFTTPAFDMPVYGAVEPVDVVAGKNKTVALNCTQSNAGVKFLWTEEFKAAFSEYAATVTQSSTTLEYPKTETRTGYFAVGNVDVVITLGTGDDQSSFSKTIAVNARELVSIKPVQSDAGAGTLTIEITIDTDVTEREEIFVIGGGNTGGSTGTEIFSEDFASASEGTNDNASGTLWDGNGGAFTALEKVYHAAGSVKLGGSGLKPGSMTSKVLDLSANGGAFTVSFKAKGWYPEDNSVIIELDGVEKTATFSTTGKAGDFADASVEFTGGTASSTIIIKTSTRVYNSNTVTQRVFIDDLKVLGADDNSGGGDDNSGGDTGSAVMMEDFASASGGTVDNASGDLWDGGSNFTSTDRIYQAAGSVKLGSSKSAGAMVSKSLDLSANGGAFTVSFKAKGWYPEDNSVIIEVGGVEKTATFTTTGKAGNLVDASVSFTGGTTTSVITIKTATRDYQGNEVTQRVFIDDFKVTN
ncbi:MAG: DUF4493 domain-containing protein [Carboxylicivirga sp.]|jgi:hypothetical protein|nr:DUF4493 domain-containing protein [Carboxylicivirga sp.]